MGAKQFASEGEGGRLAIYSPLDLSGKAAVITGGNGGIGLGMAEALAMAGADLVLFGRNAQKNEAAEEKLRAHGTRVSARILDVSDEAAVVKAMEAVVKDFGHMDAVFANAGVGFGVSSFLDLDYQTYRSVLAVNLDGVMFTLREGARHMKALGVGGSLVGVASLAAIEGAARNEHYAASKGGVISMIKGIAVEFARFGIRANAVLPGWIATDMTRMAQDAPAFAEKVIPRIPARRWGTPDDFGGIAVYLASDASRYHSGDAIVIDGGYSIY